MYKIQCTTIIIIIYSIKILNQQFSFPLIVYIHFVSRNIMKFSINVKFNKNNFELKFNIIKRSNNFKIFLL